MIEMLMVVAIIGVLAAITVPMSGNALRFIRLSGDARDISNAAAVAKMRAAAKFTQSRLFVDLSSKTFYIQTLTKTATATCTAPPCWENELGSTTLSSTEPLEGENASSDGGMSVLPLIFSSSGTWPA